MMHHIISTPLLKILDQPMHRDMLIVFLLHCVYMDAACICTTLCLLQYICSNTSVVYLDLIWNHPRNNKW